MECAGLQALHYKEWKLGRITLLTRVASGFDDDDDDQRLPRTCSEDDFLITSVGDCRGWPDLVVFAPATSLMELRVLVNQVFDCGPEDAWKWKKWLDQEN